jgi:hypothetical protein
MRSISFLLFDVSLLLTVQGEQLTGIKGEEGEDDENNLQFCSS